MVDSDLAITDMLRTYLSVFLPHPGFDALGLLNPPYDVAPMVRPLDVVKSDDRDYATSIVLPVLAPFIRIRCLPIYTSRIYTRL